MASSQPLSMGLAIVGLLKVLAVSFVCARSTVTGPNSEHQLTMIFENRNVKDGETVLVVASRDEPRKEVFLWCIAPRLFDDAVLSWPVYAQNAYLLNTDTEDCGPVPHHQEETHLASCKKIALVTGGFLKLRCVLRQSRHTDEEIDSVAANFTLTHADHITPKSHDEAIYRIVKDSTRAKDVDRPVTTSLPHQLYGPSSSGSRRPFAFTALTLSIFSLLIANIIKLTVTS